MLLVTVTRAARHRSAGETYASICRNLSYIIYTPVVVVQDQSFDQTMLRLYRPVDQTTRNHLRRCPALACRPALVNSTVFSTDSAYLSTFGSFFFFTHFCKRESTQVSRILFYSSTLSLVNTFVLSPLVAMSIASSNVLQLAISAQRPAKKPPPMLVPDTRTNSSGECTEMIETPEPTLTTCRDNKEFRTLFREEKPYQVRMAQLVVKIARCGMIVVKRLRPVVDLISIPRNNRSNALDDCLEFIELVQMHTKCLLNETLRVYSYSNHVTCSIISVNLCAPPPVAHTVEPSCVRPFLATSSAKAPMRLVGK